MASNLNSLPNVEVLGTKNKYEVFRGKFDGHLIIVYSSGTVTYDDSVFITDFLKKYKVQQGKKKMVHASDTEELSVKLSPQLIDPLIDNMKKIAREIPTTSQHEKARFELDGKKITIYHSGTIYSPKGHRKFKDVILATIKENDSRSDYDIIIGQDETGKGELFGPMVIASVAISKELSYQYQMEGMRDSKDVSNEKIEKFADIIIKNSIAYGTISIKPERFNELFEVFKEENKSLNDLLAWGHYSALLRVIESLKKEGLNTKKILVIVDEFARIKTDKRMARILSENPNISIFQTPKAENQSVAVAAASILSKFVKNKEIRKLEDELGLELHRCNLGQILCHPKAVKAVKYPYLDTEISKGLTLKSIPIEGREADTLIGKIKDQLECEQLDFKREFPKNASDIAKLISAFANTDGGEIYFGITDKKRELVGVDDPQNIEERISGLKNKLNPFPKIWITKIVCSDGKQFLKVRVDKSELPVASEGKYYKRVGSLTEIMKTEEILSYGKKQNGK